MPRKRRVSRKVAQISGVDRAAVEAGLRGEPNPVRGQCRPMLWHAARFGPGRRWQHWTTIREVFRSLPRSERGVILRIRRRGLPPLAEVYPDPRHVLMRDLDRSYMNKRTESEVEA